MMQDISRHSLVLRDHTPRLKSNSITYSHIPADITVKMAEGASSFHGRC